MTIHTYIHLFKDGLAAGNEVLGVVHEDFFQEIGEFGRCTIEKKEEREVKRVGWDFSQERIT